MGLPASGATPALVAIVGPTGTGKSDLAVDLAIRLGARGMPAEIVNADAMQLYRGMDIGTAKLPVAAWRGIPHHLFDILDVTDDAAVAHYQPIARRAIEQILARGATAILVGGSGLYVSSVIYQFQFPGTDPEIRARLERDAERQGPGELYRRLKERDEAAAVAIGATNTRRLVRALEVVELTGSPVTGALPDEPVPWKPVSVIGLRAPREELVLRLDERVEAMWRDGLVDEVRDLIPRGLDRGVTASRAIGYAQALGFVHGRLTQSDAIAETQRLTRRYARRQMSWFARYPGIAWLDYAAADLVDQALDKL